MFYACFMGLPYQTNYNTENFWFLILLSLNIVLLRTENNRKRMKNLVKVNNSLFICGFLFIV